jgi:hypothetical protein
MGKRIEVEPFRPRIGALKGSDPITPADVFAEVHAPTASAVEEALEAYKAQERAKVLARVRRHRAKKRGVK